MSFVVLDLGSAFNNDAISYASNPGDGGFNVWGNTFPAEDLPPSLSLVEVAGVPFRFPSKEAGMLNSVVCLGQMVEVPPGRYDWIYVLAASERRSEDPVYLHFEGGAVDPEWLRVSDFWPAAAHFGEIEAFRCQKMHYPRHAQPGVRAGMWRQRIPVTRGEALRAVHLPDNRAIHIFAATLARTPGPLRGPSAQPQTGRRPAGSD